VNLKRMEGLKVMRRLVRTADVLVENYVLGKLAMMGLGWEDCRALNARLIYVSITGVCAPPCVVCGMARC